MTDRKSAEACKRNALMIEKLLDGADPEQPGYAELDAERRASTRAWNDFCAQETQRMQDLANPFLSEATLRRRYLLNTGGWS